MYVNYSQKSYVFLTKKNASAPLHDLVKYTVSVFTFSLRNLEKIYRVEFSNSRRMINF